MSSSLKYAGLGASASEAPYDDEAWASPTNIYSDNATYASVTAATFDLSSVDYTTILKATTFGFAIPTGNTEVPSRPYTPGFITGIMVEIAKYHANGDVVDAVVQFTLDGTVRVGDNKADTTTHWEDAATIATYGGVNDKWGREWTAAEINATTFGVHFVAAAHGEDCDAYVDYIRVTVYYQEMFDPPQPMVPRNRRYMMTSRGDIAATPEWIVGVNIPRTVPAVPTVSVTTSVKGYTEISGVTISNGSPCVVTSIGHGISDHEIIKFTTTGALPTGLTAFTYYYCSLIGADTFNVTAAIGGANINTSSAGSGVQSCWHET
jgi:hypothetical protein